MNKKIQEVQNDEAMLLPKVDFCFKELMRDDEIRQGFIAAILKEDPEKIVWTQLLPTHLRKEYEEDKLGILDVRVMLSNGTQMDFEIQVAPYPCWPERSIFYLAKMYTEQIESGEDYKIIKKCIHVGILDFKLFPEDKEYYSCFHLWEDDRKRQYTDKLEVHIFELPKLKTEGYPESELLDWMKFMNAEKKGEFEMLAAKNKYLGKAYGKLMKLSANKEWRLEYEARQKAILDHNSLMSYNYEEGEKSGYAKGEKIGSVKTYIEDCQEFGVSKEDTCVRLMKKFEMEKEEAEKYMEEYWQ